MSLGLSGSINFQFQILDSIFEKKHFVNRPSLLLIAISLHLTAFSQYWQQQTDYKIEVALNDQQHTLKGFLTLDYTNNSPDKLDYIWFHLWPNAYKNDNTAYARQIFRDKDGKKRWKEMKDKGSMDSLDFTVNGVKAKTEAHPEHIDIIKLILPTTLAPGTKTTITTPFFVKIPTYSSRSGHLGQSYIICQWYPKPAVYDSKGWHPMPYLDQGEFYSEFGNFDVKITLPSTYVIGATGILQDANELNKYRDLGMANHGADRKPAKYSPLVSSPVKTLQYKGENIHDFAWFADKEFVIRYDTAQLPSGKIIDVFTYGYEKGNKHWLNSTSYVEDAIRHYSTWVGEYPYPVAQAVEGPQNVMSGGMEYPMITLITSPTADEPRLDAVIAHEVGHNWFYGILGSNERKHAWMDEGMNTYYQFRYEAEKYKSNSIFGDMLPNEVKEKPLAEFQGLIYNALSQLPMEEAIETHSADFPDKDKYGTVVYIKTAIWMYILELTIGQNKLNDAVKSYYQEWKFKHPYPEDFKAAIEKEIGMKADKLFEILNKKGPLD